MKKLYLIALVAVMVLPVAQTQAQFTFSVSPGFQMNGANFGYRFNKFVPFVGLQVLNVGTSITNKGMEYDPVADDIVSYTDEFKFSGTAFMPFVGARYFFKQSGKLNAYGSLMLSKIFLRGKIEDSTDPNANRDVEDFIKNTSVWGGQLGFGVEYFFDDNFSLGGEFGFMMLHARNTTEEVRPVSNPNVPPPDATFTTDTRINLRPTYTKFSLNFYFN
ncbi:MAG TPA: hypothetical protein VEC12_13145 [Bacteroidia bacterium]|nr:hypothetical protein [Bacteroidia bacterium]